jgi:hypothetical protein
VTRPLRRSSIRMRLARFVGTLSVCAGLAWLTAAALSPSPTRHTVALPAFCGTAVDSPAVGELADRDVDLTAPLSGDQGSPDSGVDDDRDDDGQAVDESEPLVTAATRYSREVPCTEFPSATFVPSSQSLRAPPSVTLL